MLFLFPSQFASKKLALLVQQAIKEDIAKWHAVTIKVSADSGIVMVDGVLIFGFSLIFNGF